MQSQDLIDRLNAEGKTSADAAKWPPHLLRAKNFKPASPDAEAPVVRKPRRLLAIAAIMLAAGAGWAASGLWLAGGKPGLAGSTAMAEAQRLAREDSSTLNRVISDLRILQAAYANVQGQVANLPVRSDVAALRKELSALGISLNKSLAAVRKRAESLDKDRVALLRGLAERVETKETAHVREIAELKRRIEALEKAKTDIAPVASIPASTRVARSEPPPPPGLSRTDKPKKPVGYVLRDVYRGAALVETRSGRLVEVVPGMRLPGAGRVRSIERQRGKWVVITSAGVIDTMPY